MCLSVLNQERLRTENITRFGMLANEVKVRGPLYRHFEANILKFAWLSSSFSILLFMIAKWNGLL